MNDLDKYNEEETTVPQLNAIVSDFNSELNELRENINYIGEKINKIHPIENKGSEVPDPDQNTDSISIISDLKEKIKRLGVYNHQLNVLIKELDKIIE